MEVEKFRCERCFQCKCDCGKVNTIELSKLRSGHTRSCGCLRRDVSRANSTSHGESKTKLYMIWSGMKERCLNTNNKRYRYYGERGIGVFSGWLDFVTFRNWAIDKGYREGLSIERNEVNGNYEPSNCRWIPKSDQPKNTRSNIVIFYNGQKKYLQRWADEFGINRSTLQGRLNRGMSVHESLTTPVGELVSHAT